MRVIDMHAHAFPDRVAASALAVVGGNAGVVPEYDGTLEGLRRLAAEAGVTRSVVQPVASRPSQVQSINEWASEAGDERVTLFAAMHPDLPDLEAEVTRLAVRGFLGFKLHPEYQSFRPDEERLDPLYATAARHNLIVYFHAGEDLGLPGVHSTPEIFASVLDRHPDLTLVLAHMGGWRQWDDVHRHLVGRQVYLDTSFSLAYLGAEGFVDLVEAHGVERVVFGSDVPWANLRSEIAMLSDLPLSTGDLDTIFWRNAAALLDRAATSVAGVRR